MRPLRTRDLSVISTIAFLVTLACLALLIANISNVQLGEGGNSISPTASQLVPIAVFVLIGIWVCFFVIILARLFVRGSPPKVAQPKPGSIMTYIVALLILTSILAVISLTNLQLNPTDPNSSQQQGQQNQNITSGRQNGWSASAPTLIVVAVLVAVIGVSIWLTLRSYRGEGMVGRRSSPPGSPRDGVTVIDEAIEDLRTSDDAREAIIRIYAQMCKFMRPEERKALTPRELKGLAVSGYGWPERPVEELTAIFEEARYSDHQIPERSRDTALACLDQIKVALPKQKGGEAVA
ncbi:MAG: DUF4129 domain-containing protein [Methanomassiliicoccales archaeon]